MLGPMRRLKARAKVTARVRPGVRAKAGTLLRDVIRRLPGVRSRPVARCLRMDVRSESELRGVALQLAAATDHDAGAVQVMLRELASLNTPALFLNVLQPGSRVRIMLQPSGGRSIRFRGESFLVEAGSEAPEGIEAFSSAAHAHVTALYPTVPDHPVYVISIENQGPSIYLGEFPPYLTHVTIVANGRVITRAERLLHERGLQVWAA